MKKIWYLVGMFVSTIILGLLTVVSLQYYGAITVNDLSFLPTANKVIDFGSNETISGIIGFSSIKEVGQSFIIISIYLLFTYFMVMLTLYQFNNVSRSVVFWVNVVLYSFGLSLLLIGFLFNFLEL